LAIQLLKQKFTDTVMIIIIHIRLAYASLSTICECQMNGWCTLGGLHWAPRGEYIASYVGTAYCFDVDSRPISCFLFMSRHLQYLLVLWLQHACNLLLQWNWESHFLFLRFA